MVATETTKNCNTTSVQIRHQKPSFGGVQWPPDAILELFDEIGWLVTFFRFDGASCCAAVLTVPGLLGRRRAGRWGTRGGHATFW